jgi:hypothetical protein
MRLYPILALSAFGIVACEGGPPAPPPHKLPLIAESGTVLRTEVPAALLAEIVARAAALPATGKTRLAALPIVTDAPPAAPPDGGAAGVRFDGDAVDAAMDALGAIIRAAHATPAAAASGSRPFVSYTVRLDRGTTVQIAQPWHPGEQIVGPRERAAIRLVGGSRRVLPEDASLPPPAR